jgi:DNA-binding GntR family transcriptional regulator
VCRWLPPTDLDDTFTGSVLDLLRQRHTVRIQDALADITAVGASRPLAQRLGVHPGAALLLLEETLFDATGTPVGFSRNYFVPERFRFHVVRR